MSHNDQFESVTLYISGTVNHIKIFGTQVFFFIFLKKYVIVNIQILTFFIGPLQQFFK